MTVLYRRRRIIHHNNNMAAPIKHISPLGKLAIEKSSFESENSRHKAHIREHVFNSCVDVMIPGCGTVPAELEACLTPSQPVFLASSVPLSHLVKPEFIEGFIKRGRLYALSQGTHIDSHDCIALLPTGTLLLHLTKDTYQELGLEGKPSIYDKKQKSPLKYVVRVDLTASSFVPGKKMYERVQWCLQDRLGLSFSLLLTWQPNDAKICSSSIQNYFRGSGITCHRVEPFRKTRRYQDLQVPVISPDHPVPVVSPDAVDSSCHYNDVFDWLGACAAEIDLSAGSPDSYTSSYTCPSPSELVNSAVSCQLTGLYTTEYVSSLLEALRSYVREKRAPWGCVTVHGFMDSPVSGSQLEHGFCYTGDNLYTFLVFPDQQYWLYTATGDRNIVT